MLIDIDFLLEKLPNTLSSISLSSNCLTTLVPFCEDEQENFKNWSSVNL